MTEKFSIPTETVELPSKGLVYDKENPLSEGSVEMKYMTAREEDILTNVNLLKKGIAIERVLEALIKSPIKFDDLTVGDRNALLIAARILAYGASYSFEYRNPDTDISELVTVDLQKIQNRVVDYSLFKNKNEFTYELPYSKNVVTFKLLTVADEKALEAEAKGLKKANLEAGEITSRLKKQITSINGDYDPIKVRQFVDNYLIAKDSSPLRAYIYSVTPDIDLKIDFTLADGTDITESLPLTADFFFPRS